MGKVVSIKGVGVPGLRNWSWCVPAGRSVGRMPVVVYCITDDGPRFLPTNIAAPNDYRHKQVDYVELAPSASEILLAESIWAWLTSSWGPDASLGLVVKEVGLLHDVLAASRFLPISSVPCMAATPAIPESDLYLGRSVCVRPRGLPRSVMAWITSNEDPFELVCLDFAGMPRRFFADWDCLAEDGTFPENHKR